MGPPRNDVFFGLARIRGMEGRNLEPKSGSVNVDDERARAGVQGEHFSTGDLEALMDPKFNFALALLGQSAKH